LTPTSPSPSPGSLEYPGHAQRPIASLPSSAATLAVHSLGPPPNVPLCLRRVCPQRPQSGEPLQFTQPLLVSSE
jgi:hypothetical protein